MDTDSPVSRIEPTATDPFSAFISTHATSVQQRTAKKRLNGGEHAWLGSQGAAAACVRLQKSNIDADEAMFKSIPRKDERESLQYGELVALSGDFYETPDDVFDEKPSALPWLWEANDLSDVRAVFAQELHWIETRLTQPENRSPYPDASVRLAWNAKSYVELALRNVDHFGWHNQLAYVRYHQAALELALQANGRNDERWRRALFTNAFADHFLTDGFAAGHIRVPRAEICDWADSLHLDPKVAGALSKLLHDQDGHADLATLHGEHEPHAGSTPHPHRHGVGLPVLNARDESWETFCDGQLFLNRSEHDPAVCHAVEAVADSVEELVMAWKQGVLPGRSYKANSRVPFVDPAAPTLIQKFPAQMLEEDIERLWKSIDWYGKIPWLTGLKREHLRLLFAALPELMEALRSRVRSERHGPEAAYLDPGYVGAFATVA
jgi:hypothetical protein